MRTQTRIPDQRTRRSLGGTPRARQGWLRRGALPPHQSPRPSATSSLKVRTGLLQFTGPVSHSTNLSRESDAALRSSCHHTPTLLTAGVRLVKVAASVSDRSLARRTLWLGNNPLDGYVADRVLPSRRRAGRTLEGEIRPVGRGIGAHIRSPRRFCQTTASIPASSRGSPPSRRATASALSSSPSKCFPGRSPFTQPLTTH